MNKGIEGAPGRNRTSVRGLGNRWSRCTFNPSVGEGRDRSGRALSVAVAPRSRLRKNQTATASSSCSRRAGSAPTTWCWRRTASRNAAVGSSPKNGDAPSLMNV